MGPGLRHPVADTKQHTRIVYINACQTDKRELQILTEGASNFEFHYLGSGKILGQIGKAFAEAMAQLMKN